MYCKMTKIFQFYLICYSFIQFEKPELICDTQYGT
jgi:hypothetical protein